jgi:haloacetate dehalogenase
VAPRLAEAFTIVAPDLRGYGDSSKPPGGDDHAGYSKRAMAQDQVEVMGQLGFERFSVAGHDRGARVAHRMALDHPERVARLALLDIVPTLYRFEHVDQHVATGAYHWFFLIQPGGLPETLIGASTEFYLRHSLRSWSATPDAHEPAAFAEYLRCFQAPETIRATCEDYRAGASIDLEHDRADLDKKIACPLLVLWGATSEQGSSYDILSIWRERATTVTGRPIKCGHFLPEEAPEETAEALRGFFAG